MSENTFKFNEVEIKEKEFHASKPPIGIHSVDINQIVIFDKFQHSNKCVKYFIGYAGNDVIRPLCIVLPQMSGYIKYFENGGKNISFRIEDDSVLIRYNEIWNRIKGLLSVKYHSKFVYDEKYLQTKVKTFNSAVHNNLLG